MAATCLPCAGVGQELEVPVRPAGALTGSELGRVVTGLDLEDRERRIVSEFLAGNVPSWLRHLAPVDVDAPRDNDAPIVLYVTPDYLAVGSDEDYLRIPLSPYAAQEIADSLGMSLPTPRIVDLIWRSAVTRLDPSPIDPSPEMTTLPVFIRHDGIVGDQAAARSHTPGTLLAGHKKDVVVSAELASRPGRVAIYGWHQRDGSPIQPLYLGHTADWVDYSHGVRLIARTIRVGGERFDLHEALRLAPLADRLSHEGPVLRPRYPNGR